MAIMVTMETTLSLVWQLPNVAKCQIKPIYVLFFYSEYGYAQAMYVGRLKGFV